MKFLNNIDNIDNYELDQEDIKNLKKLNIYNIHDLKTIDPKIFGSEFGSISESSKFVICNIKTKEIMKDDKYMHSIVSSFSIDHLTYDSRFLKPLVVKVAEIYIPLDKTYYLPQPIIKYKKIKKGGLVCKELSENSLLEILSKTDIGNYEVCKLAIEIAKQKGYHKLICDNQSNIVFIIIYNDGKFILINRNDIFDNIL